MHTAMIMAQAMAGIKMGGSVKVFQAAVKPVANLVIQ